MRNSITQFHYNLRNFIINKYKESYISLSSAIYGEKLLSINSAISFKVYFYLLGKFSKIPYKKSEIILEVTQKEIGAEIATSQQQIAKSLAELKEKGLLKAYARGKIILNPSLVWKEK